MIDLVALRSLIAVRDHGSVVAAAGVLGFTPSAVSQQLKRLEGPGSPVLERVGRGVVLTERGRLLADRGGRVLDELEALDHVAHQAGAPVVGSLHLASFATAKRGLVAPALGLLAERAPDLRVTLSGDDPRDVVDAVARGVADLGVVHDWESVHLDLPSGLDADLLLTDRADLVVHRDHRFAERASVEPDDLVGEPWVVPPPGTICHDWLMAMFAGRAERPDVRYLDAEYATHLGIIATGAALGLVPRLGRGPLPSEVVVVPVERPRPIRQVQAVWRRSTTDNPARRLVHEVLREVAGQVSA